jgi:hypothetical protein
MVAPGWTKRRDEYQPHVARVLRIGAGLEDASIHHDPLANLKPACGEQLVEQQAAPGPAVSSPGGAQLHVGRADDDKLTPTRANVKQEADGSGPVRLTAHDLPFEGDDASRIEPIDPHDVLEREPIVPEREAGPLQGLVRADPPRKSSARLRK